ncbi:hypothetical protein [Salinibacillus xinjiangensis]|uniref:Uncharacterized protein n=1 Tax=Salinibacillus xinjiangensis TaxID=1229268 RepID=A0A6G1X8W3_9BACI|nr:hypothetical protein [Salinibacillus xinjiangensis]MRG87382.1 hypothetical protein [Salinibacillus xinjiangensis]
MNKYVPFKQSRIIPTSILLFMMGFLVSFLPEENWTLLWFNFLLAALCSVIFFILWRLHRGRSKRYFSLLSYIMLNALTVYFSIPIFRLIYGTIAFWVCVVILATMIFLPYLYAEEMAVGINQPQKSKLGKIYTIFAPLLIIFGGFIYMGSLSTSNPDALFIAIFLFLGAVLFLCISPVLLIQPQRMKELERK